VRVAVCVKRVPIKVMRGNPKVFPRLRRGSPRRYGRFAPGLLSFRYKVRIV